MLEEKFKEKFCFNNVKLNFQQYLISIGKSPVTRNTLLILFLLRYMFRLKKRAIFKQNVTVKVAIKISYLTS
jgi:hypothetical protein